jgi:hypothetical protein
VVNRTTAGKRLAYLLQEQEILGAGYYVLSRNVVLIHGNLDMGEKVLCTLRFIKYDLFIAELAQESLCIFQCQIPLRRVLQRDIMCVSEGCLRQCGFARLPWTGQSNYRKQTRGPLENGLQMALYHNDIPEFDSDFA